MADFGTPARNQKIGYFIRKYQLRCEVLSNHVKIALLQANNGWLCSISRLCHHVPAIVTQLSHLYIALVRFIGQATCKQQWWQGYLSEKQKQSGLFLNTNFVFWLDTSILAAHEIDNGRWVSLWLNIFSLRQSHNVKLLLLCYIDATLL